MSPAPRSRSAGSTVAVFGAGAPSWNAVTSCCGAGSAAAGVSMTTGGVAVSCGACAATATAAESTHAFISVIRAAAVVSAATAPPAAMISTGGAGRGGGVTSPVNWADAAGTARSAAAMKLRVGMRTTITSRGSSALPERAFPVPRKAEVAEVVQVVEGVDVTPIPYRRLDDLDDVDTLGYLCLSGHAFTIASPIRAIVTCASLSIRQLRSSLSLVRMQATMRVWRKKSAQSVRT